MHVRKYMPLLSKMLVYHIKVEMNKVDSFPKRYYLSYSEYPRVAARARARRWYTHSIFCRCSNFRRTEKLKQLALRGARRDITHLGNLTSQRAFVRVEEGKGERRKRNFILSFCICTVVGKSIRTLWSLLFYFFYFFLFFLFQGGERNG